MGFPGAETLIAFAVNKGAQALFGGDPEQQGFQPAAPSGGAGGGQGQEIFQLLVALQQQQQQQEAQRQAVLAQSLQVGPLPPQAIQSQPAPQGRGSLTGF